MLGKNTFKNVYEHKSGSDLYHLCFFNGPINDLDLSDVCFLHMTGKPNNFNKSKYLSCAPLSLKNNLYKVLASTKS